MRVVSLVLVLASLAAAAHAEGVATAEVGATGEVDAGETSLRVRIDECELRLAEKDAQLESAVAKAQADREAVIAQAQKELNELKSQASAQANALAAASEERDVAREEVAALAAEVNSLRAAVAAADEAMAGSSSVMHTAGMLGSALCAKADALASAINTALKEHLGVDVPELAREAKATLMDWGKAVWLWVKGVWEATRVLIQTRVAPHIPAEVWAALKVVDHWLGVAAKHLETTAMGSQTIRWATRNHTPFVARTVVMTAVVLACVIVLAEVQFVIASLCCARTPSNSESRGQSRTRAPEVETSGSSGANSNSQAGTPGGRRRGKKGKGSGTK